MPVLQTLTDPRYGVLTLTLTLTLTDSRGGDFFLKVALTYIPDPNRSTTINFVDVNGKPIYIVDWCMVVMEGGNVLHCVK